MLPRYGIVEAGSVCQVFIQYFIDYGIYPCDAYHCSVMSLTSPNRYYLWTGWVGNDGKGGGSASIYFDLRSAYGWYDLSVTTNAHPHFQRRLAGHVETGRSSMSDPALGRGADVEAPPVRQMYSKLAD
jgi:hypothetical protein